MSARPEVEVMIDVLAEHLDEAAFLVERLTQAWVDPSLTLAEVARTFADRLSAHVDGLVLGAAAARDEVLVPALSPPAQEEPALITAAALALLELGAYALVQPLLAHEALPVRRATTRAISLAGPRVEAWVTSAFTRATSDPERATLMEAAAARDLALPHLEVLLRSAEPLVLAAAARAARATRAPGIMKLLTPLLEHPSEAVRREALPGALAVSARGSLEVLRTAALTQRVPDAMALLAGLGGQAEREALLDLAGDPEAGPAAIRALGFSGASAVIPGLLDFVERDDLPARHAALSLGMLLGLDPRADELIRARGSASDSAEQEARALPPLEEDALDQDLVPPPEASLSPPDPGGWRRAWEAVSSKVQPGVRLMYGRPLSPAACAVALEQMPMAGRSELALLLEVLSGGAVRVNTEAPLSRQREALGAARHARFVRSVPAPHASHAP